MRIRVEETKLENLVAMHIVKEPAVEATLSIPEAIKHIRLASPG